MLSSTAAQRCSNVKKLSSRKPHANENQKNYNKSTILCVIEYGMSTRTSHIIAIVLKLDHILATVSSIAREQQTFEKYSEANNVTVTRQNRKVHSSAGFTLRGRMF